MDNYNAMFHTHSNHCCREMHNNSRLKVKFWQSTWSIKYRSRALDHGACLKSVSMTTTMQGSILAAITAAEKCTSILDST